MPTRLLLPSAPGVAVGVPEFVWRRMKATPSVIHFVGGNRGFVPFGAVLLDLAPLNLEIHIVNAEAFAVAVSSLRSGERPGIRLGTNESSPVVHAFAGQ